MEGMKSPMESKSMIERGESYHGKIFGDLIAPSNRIMVGIPMLGLLRAEWVLARYGQTIPCNWAQTDAIQWIDAWSPVNFQVADARNIIATACVEKGFEWLFFIDHDVILPPGIILRLNERMQENKVPIWSGLYFTKSTPSEPLVYRGRGNSYYKDWKIGDEVWVDGLPMGCTMIHSSILKVLYNNSEVYEVKGMTARKIFETPARVWFDPEKQSFFSAVGTEDLEFCNRVLRENAFVKAGWKEYDDKQFPFLIDTGLFCRHIDQNGIQFPAHGEELGFLHLEK